jgi:hypothetical protein
VDESTASAAEQRQLVKQEALAGSRKSGEQHDAPLRHACQGSEYLGILTDDDAWRIARWGEASTPL